MKINIKDTTMVRPVEATPNGSLWISNIDVLMHNYHTPSVYFYRRPAGVANFFDSAVLKAALGRALVAFYPAAGRLHMNGDGRIEINCNSEGVLFVEAESDGSLDDLSDFTPKPDLSLIPIVDYLKGISTYPLVLFQVTHFKCGGVCLGVRNEHHLSDGISALHFIKTWADIARGLDITIPPVIDRSHLSASHPPQPQFDHIEYNQPAPTMNVPSDASLETIIQSVFKLTRDQLNSLKSNCKDDKNDISYSSIEVLGGHVWRCVCKARGLKEDQETMIRIPVDGRSRLQPPPPRGYYGNVIFSNTRIAVSGEIVSKPLKHVVSIVHDAIIQMNNDYLRSTIDYLELQPDLLALAIGDHTFNGPNLSINSWVRMPVYDADFGWGKPVYMGPEPIYTGPGAISREGKVIMLPSPINDGSILLLIALPKEHMKLFEKIVYEI
ncbi:hypothetical protein RD792_015189 [Penstemon davidsonii]|uniref:Uncharacterized protein n=1 Tax=Penstemon davidsonii TaxID=160366 RepID=A0ABR0CT44_9LAMI|nr:hypothetical protein RD792_015189 [Penstemon davidsonii]